MLISVLVIHLRLIVWIVYERFRNYSMNGSSVSFSQTNRFIICSFRGKQNPSIHGTIRHFSTDRPNLTHVAGLVFPFVSGNVLPNLVFHIRKKRISRGRICDTDPGIRAFYGANPFNCIALK